MLGTKPLISRPMPPKDGWPRGKRPWTTCFKRRSPSQDNARVHLTNLVFRRGLRATTAHASILCCGRDCAIGEPQVTLAATHKQPRVRIPRTLNKADDNACTRRLPCHVPSAERPMLSDEL